MAPKEPTKVLTYDKPGQSRPPPEEIEQEQEEERAKLAKLQQEQEEEKEKARQQQQQQQQQNNSEPFAISPKPIEPEPEAKRGFPHELGPFGIRPTNFGQASFKIMWEDRYHKGGMFTMDKPVFGKNPSLKSLAMQVQDWPIIGQLSPAHPITLNEEAKRKALIPVTATSFVWSYPVVLNIDISKAKDINPADPDTAFLLVGGYTYFDVKDEVCGVNTIIPAKSGLIFSKPKQWNHDYTDALHKYGRFQPITIKFLHDLGARHFCWIRPDEPIGDGWGSAEKLCPNGGFVYLFHDRVTEGTKEERAKDRYFHVLSGKEYEEYMAKLNK